MFRFALFLAAVAGSTVCADPPTFERDVMPLLARFGCNAGACHGKARGQNGFQLSLLGFDPDFDYHAIAHDARGRRVFPAAPESSLLLRKAAAEVPHGGGKRLTGAAYDTVRAWLVAGMPRSPADAPKLDGIVADPADCTLTPGAKVQLRVVARYSDGSTADVTHLAMFQSNESVLANVDANGLIAAGPLPGEVAVTTRFMDSFAVCRVALPVPGPTTDERYAKLPRANVIDGPIWDQLRRLNLPPSVPCGDATFLRRAHLDVIGRLPTAAEARTFLADTAPDKRAKLIDRLLNRPEYADFWANKWADLLRPNPYRVGIKAVYNLDAWLRDAFRRNLPYDRFVRELLTAKGSTFRNGATVVLRDRREPDEIASVVSQLFLGVRLDCAKCHHHPFEAWGQDDFYGFAAYFGRIGHLGTGLSPPISGGEEALTLASKGEVYHPVTGAVMRPKPLAAPAPELGERDPREALADWVTAPDNPTFAKVIVNRVWADLMGRGIVDPVDDLRATNPPSNGPLLDALAADFRANGHDLKKLLKTILSSHAYALSSKPVGANAGDQRNFSRHYRQRLRAEVLLDAVCDITGVPETFAAMPTRSRAMELWTVRGRSPFLDSFGRPDPNQDPPCERTTDTTVVQALHLMNAPGVQDKIASDAGRAAALAKGKNSPREIVDELYLAAFSRFPDDGERRVGEALFAKPTATRRQAVEDLLWALFNTAEFVFED